MKFTSAAIRELNANYKANHFVNKLSYEIDRGYVVQEIQCRHPFHCCAMSKPHNWGSYLLISIIINYVLCCSDNHTSDTVVLSNQISLYHYTLLYNWWHVSWIVIILGCSLLYKSVCISVKCYFFSNSKFCVYW